METNVAYPTFSEVVCPKCRSKLTLDPPQRAGSKVTCGICGHELVLEAPDRKAELRANQGLVAGGFVGALIGAVTAGLLGAVVGLLAGPLGALILGIVAAGLGAQGGALLFGLLGAGVASAGGSKRQRVDLSAGNTSSRITRSHSDTQQIPGWLIGLLLAAAAFAATMMVLFD